MEAVQPLINCRIVGVYSIIVVLEDVKPKLMESINIYANGRKIRGKIIEIRGTRSWAQVYESLAGVGLGNARVECTGDVFKMPLSEDMIGQFFDGSGNPKDRTFTSFPEKYADIEPRPINPICVKYPTGLIQTGIGAIDLLNGVAIGKGYTIYSAAGLPHNTLVAQIIRQATVLKQKDEQNFSEEFTIVFAGISLTPEAMRLFTAEFRELETKHKVTSFMNGIADPVLEQLLTPRLAITFAEYLAFEKHKHVLVVLTDMTAYCDAMRSMAPTRGDMDLKYPTNLASDLALLLDRSGMVEGRGGSMTVMPIVTMPNDAIEKISVFGGVTQNFLVLDRKLHNRGFYPPIDFCQNYRVCYAVYGVTREDHFAVANQIYQLYFAALEVAEYRAVVGESTISEHEVLHLKFLDKFERRLLKQSSNEAWSDNAKLLEVAWQLLRVLPRDWLRCIPERLKMYYSCRKNPD